MSFDKAEFIRFCGSLRVDTKESGIVSLGDVLMGTQKYFIDEIAEGLNRGVHYFIVLKGRQVMITTICLALDLYWSMKHEGVQGTLITDTEENRDMFRETLTMYLEGLPNQWKQPVIRHNRTQLTFRNRSRFLYQVAGTKKKEKRSVGVGKAVMFMHATECSNWGDDGALADIEASLAQRNPKRLYIFESTARGPNGFQDMWETAQRSNTQKAIFVGWWRNDFYRFKKGSAEYNVYWDGRLSGDEAAWVEEVKRLYDYEIADEQIAWWRWMLAEHVHEETRMMENYPPTENHAFVMSGSQFFTATVLSDRMKMARAKAPDNYRFVTSASFEDCDVVPADDNHANLRVWEPPKPDAFYVLGCDPAYGSSEWADRFCIQVFRCYADGMEQVAEYCTEQCTTYQFAWVMMYLAGAYQQAMINLEINGPGQAVWVEIQNMKRLAGNYGENVSAGVVKVISQVENYLYRRADTIGGGFNYHWKTTGDSKERMMNALKDGFERGLIIINSTGWMREAKNVVRTDGSLGAPGRGKDDRVIGAALATVAWTDFLRLRLAAAGHTKARAAATRDPRAVNQPIQRNIQGYLKAIRILDKDGQRSVH